MPMMSNLKRQFCQSLFWMEIFTSVASSWQMLSVTSSLAVMMFLQTTD